MRLAISALAIALCISLPAPAQERAARADTSFSKEVAPILKASCAKCHDAKLKKGGLDVSTYDTFKKGGKSGAAFTAGDPGNSLLISDITGDKPVMPKGMKGLAKPVVDLITKWVKEGAKNN